MSHRHFTAQLGQFGGCSGHSGQTPTGTALAIINTTYRWGGVYYEGTDFGRRERKVSREGVAATSSVKSFQSLIVLGKMRISCSQYSRRALHGYKREWE